MKALRNDDFDSYWTQTSAAESLMEYISLDYDGLSKTIAELIGGIEVEVDTSGFSNDLVTFREKDDVLTLLIHLGYLAYDKETEKCIFQMKKSSGNFQGRSGESNGTRQFNVCVKATR